MWRPSFAVKFEYQIIVVLQIIIMFMNNSLATDISGAVPDVKNVAAVTIANDVAVAAALVDAAPLVTNSDPHDGNFSNDIAAADATIGTVAALKSGYMGPLTKCLMSEFTCTNGRCIPLNKFCDKQNDCGDNTDEPRFCTSKYELMDKSHLKSDKLIIFF